MQHFEAGIWTSHVISSIKLHSHAYSRIFPSLSFPQNSHLAEKFVRKNGGNLKFEIIPFFYTKTSLLSGYKHIFCQNCIQNEFTIYIIKLSHWCFDLLIIEHVCIKPCAHREVKIGWICKFCISVMSTSRSSTTNYIPTMTFSSNTFHYKNFY